MGSGRTILAALAVAGPAALFAAGCENTADIIQERERLKNHAALAQLYYDKGRYNLAISQAEKALEIDESYSKARCVLGFTYIQCARLQEAYASRVEMYEKAEEHFDRAILDGSETDSFIFKSYFGLGLLYSQWAKDVDAQMRSADRGPADAVDGPSTGEEDIWKE